MSAEDAVVELDGDDVGVSDFAAPESDEDEPADLLSLPASLELFFA